MEDNQIFIRGVVEALKTTIKYDVSIGQEKSHTQYLEFALDTFKARYKMIHKMSKYALLKPDTTRDIVVVWEEIKPEVIETIEKFLKDFRHKKLTKEIKAASAKAAIAAAMKEAGLKHQFTAQTHRAKVSVLITDNRALTTYISYKKLYDQLPSVIESLKIIRHELKSIGSQVTINKAYNILDWE